MEGAHEGAGGDVAGIRRGLQFLEGGLVAILAGLVEEVEIDLLAVLAVGGFAPIRRGFQQEQREAGHEGDGGLGQDEPGGTVARIRVPERRVRAEPVGPAHDFAFM